MKKSAFSDILVCVDSSNKSQKALIKAIAIAEKFDSSLTILMVIEEGIVDFWSDTEFSSENKNQIKLKKDSQIYQQAKKIMNDFKKRIPSKVKCKTEILTGDPARVIINYSKRKKPDIIVIGSRGLGGFSKLLLGSVSSKVSEHTSTSVLIVR
ncbi:MAG: universal stress protein [Nitrosopumilaceae archaeon]|nr:universal stress protein [Nitrosopumilaceae archaeon]